MFETVTSLGRNGLQDWVIQRLTAIILAVYTLFLFFYILHAPTHRYAEWLALFSSQGMRYASVLALISLLAHAWIGLWTVTTDYIKPLSIRFAVQILILLSLFVYLFWAIEIFYDHRFTSF